MMSYVVNRSWRGTPSTLSNISQVDQSKYSKKRLLKTMPAGSQWPHSIRRRLWWAGGGIGSRIAGERARHIVFGTSKPPDFERSRIGLLELVRPALHE